MILMGTLIRQVMAGIEPLLQETETKSGLG